MSIPTIFAPFSKAAAAKRPTRQHQGLISHLFHLRNFLNLKNPDPLDT